MLAGTMIYPLTFTPIFRDYLWGGRRLETLYGRELPPGIVAESWEIAGHPNGSTIADGGYWQGQSLPAILAALGERLTGTRAGWALARQRFPLLVKLLDARQDLSLQVHPDDAYALVHEGGELGKTEMWYVLHADPGATLIRGLQADVDKEALRAALRTGDLDAVLKRVPVRAGQVFDVPAGMVHALLTGTVVAEIQQNSDTTYRVHDWGRLGADGKLRTLHIDRALDVIDFTQTTVDTPPRRITDTAGLRRTEVVRNRYFVVEEVELTRDGVYEGACNGETMEIWGCVQGEAAIESAGARVPLPAIRFAVLPAVLGEFRVRAAASARCLRAYLPENP